MIDAILHDRYQIRDRLTRKAGRSTFLAFDLQSKNLVIVKLVRLDTEFKWDDLKLFEREAKTLKNISHQAIPEYLDYFEISDGFALVQTYIDAPSLESVIKDGRKFSELELIELADRLLSILTYIHELSPLIIHRDIKPSNILLGDRSGSDVYLVDFGAVQTVASTDGDTMTIAGTYGYMAPEQFGNRTTTASDLYGLGMTCLNLITGVHPADLKRINGKVKFDRTHLSNRFSRWLDRMTELDPDRRFSSAKLAQTTLKSADSESNLSDFYSMDSSIQLSGNRDKLDIQLPGIIKTKILVIQWRELIQNCFHFWYFPLTIIFLFLTKPLVGIIYLGLLLYPAFPLLGLTINHKYIHSPVISIDRICKYLKIGTHSTLTNQISWKGKSDCQPIDAIIYHPPLNSHSHTGSVTTEPKITIHRGKKEYSITNGISAAELEWLGEELSNFLNLELHVIHPILPNPTPSLTDWSQSDCSSCGCV
jgi:serine/threonine protein kinase